MNYRLHFQTCWVMEIEKSPMSKTTQLSFHTKITKSCRTWNVLCRCGWIAWLSASLLVCWLLLTRKNILLVSRTVLLRYYIQQKRFMLQDDIVFCICLLGLYTFNYYQISHFLLFTIFKTEVEYLGFDNWKESTTI